MENELPNMPEMDSAGKKAVTILGLIANKKQIDQEIKKFQDSKREELEEIIDEINSQEEDLYEILEDTGRESIAVQGFKFSKVYKPELRAVEIKKLKGTEKELMKKTGQD